MTALIIDGKTMAQKVREELSAKISKLHIQPYLAVVLVGDDEASLIYDRNKKKAAEAAGMKCVIHHLAENVSEKEVVNLIEKLNRDNEVNGIIVQMPLPKHLNANKIIEKIDFTKDVDGFGFENLGRLHANEKSAMVAATPQGVLYMLKETLGDLSGKNAVIIGRSVIVGRPLASLLLNHNCTVTIAHSKTLNLSDLTKQADIVIAACGCPKMVKKDWIKEGAAVVDVGINRIDGKLCGDVDFDEVKEKAGYITPVPGGVGPLTVAMLLKNTLCAYIKQNEGLENT